MRVRPVGRRALLVELGSAAEVQALHAELLRRRAAGLLPAVREIVPAAGTILLDGLDAPDRLAAELPSWDVPPLTETDAGRVTVPVRFDGPDLAEVAGLWGVRPEDVPDIVTGLPFRVAFCGFAPGFGYLTGLPDALHVPRRDTPRTAVPTGSLGLAGGYAGVYPRSSPGGWQLIGTAQTVLWDPARDPAALLAPGARVRFTDAGADADTPTDGPGSPA
ncbi:allophanate hydrolase subunit 1 [Streptomyces sp. NPDC060194]|uniref:5-oxoprolinase subunit B family protein n=1 Tax=Streptomyces sp. NPDC060194 TaxID=3347069 RepID=UPI00364973FB